MKFWVGVTDKNWFQDLAEQQPDEVNFWQPSGTRQFKALQSGEPFLFKLHSPDNFIVGGAHFVRYSALPASLAWEAFQRKNGVKSLEELIGRVRKYRRTDSLDPVIGCNVLTIPFFLPRLRWIPAPAGWSPNIVQGRSYDVDTDGKLLWEAVRTAVILEGRVMDLSPAIAGNQPRFGQEFLARARLGQGAFRVLVTDAYQRCCAITGEKTLPVLEAAHIKPYSEEGPHRVNNGLLLRSDLHKLFDLGYVTVTPDLTVEVSARLRQDWSNGRDYYAFHGRMLSNIPQRVAARPSPEFLAWHNESRFKA
jgi:putative restriction endonuclease